MSKEKYFELIDNLCDECQIREPQTLYETCDLVVLGIAFTILYHEDTECVVVFCDFGAAPEENRSLVLRRLLEANMFTLNFFAPCFAFNPETEHVLLRAHFPLEGLTAQELLNMLGTHAAMAAEWRRTHFLTDMPAWNDASLPETPEAPRPNA